MPRSLRQVVDHAEQLRRQGSELTGLRDAVLAAARAEVAVAKAVRQARRDGHSWAAIGAVLGTSGQAANQRYREEP